MEQQIDEKQIKKDIYGELKHAKAGLIFGTFIMIWAVILTLLMTSGKNGMPFSDAKWFLIGGGGIALFLILLDGIHELIRKPKFEEKKRLLESTPVKGEVIEIREYRNSGLTEHQIPLGGHTIVDDKGNATRVASYKNRTFRLLVKYYDRSQYSDMYMLSRSIPFKQPDIKIGDEVDVYLSGDGKATIKIPGVDK